MAVSLLNLGESTTQTIGAFLARSTDFSSFFEVSQGICPTEILIETAVFFCEAPYCCTMLHLLTATGARKGWLEILFVFVNFQRFYGLEGFSRFCKVFFSTRACHWAFAGTSLDSDVRDVGDIR